MIGLHSAYRNPLKLILFVILPVLSVAMYAFFKIAGDLDVPARELFVILLIIFMFEVFPAISSFSDAISLWARNRKTVVSSFEITEDFLVLNNPGIENKIDWSMINKITETKRYYFAKMGNIQFTWPKKGISEHAELRTIIEKCLGSKAKLKRKYG